MAGKEAFDAAFTPAVPSETARLLGQADAATNLVTTIPLLSEALNKKGVAVASAAITVLAGTGSLYHITGVVTITDIDFGVTYDGRWAIVEFDGALLLTHSASLRLPGEVNLQTAAGDRMLIVVDSLDNVTVVAYIPVARALVMGKALAADAATNSTVTAAKITGLDHVVGPGIYAFEYWLRYQAAALTTGIKVSVNHTGTVTSFMANTRHINSAATITGAPSQIANASTAQPWQGASARAKSAAAGMGPTLSVDTINADMMMIVEGMMVVTVSGNIELWHASEVAAASTIKAGSMLRLTKTG